MANRACVRTLKRGDYVTVRDHPQSRVALATNMQDPPDGVRLVLQPLDGSDPFETEHPDPTEYVDVGWGFSVGLPVAVYADSHGVVRAEVDWSELVSAVADEPSDPHILKVLEQWVDLFDIFPVTYPKVSDPSRIERCLCGAPIAKWYDPEPDGDVTPRSDCLTYGCSASTT